MIAVHHYAQLEKLTEQQLHINTNDGERGRKNGSLVNVIPEKLDES